jgi:hypothetical protein
MVLDNKNIINILLDKKTYLPGETIRGKITFDFKRPIAGRKFKVILSFQKFINAWGAIDSATNKIYPTQTIIELDIDNEREYQYNIYPFQIQIPNDIFYKTKNWMDKIFKQFPDFNFKQKALKYRKKGYVKFEENEIYYIEAVLQISDTTEIKNIIELNLNNGTENKTNYLGETKENKPVEIVNKITDKLLLEPINKITDKFNTQLFSNINFENKYTKEEVNEISGGLFDTIDTFQKRNIIRIILFFGIIITLLIIINILNIYDKINPQVYQIGTLILFGILIISTPIFMYFHYKYFLKPMFNTFKRFKTK